MSPARKIFKVDSFTDVPFRGNPAGVCLIDEEVSDEWMQAIAAEMNVSETAFARPVDERFWIRYFTPAVEVPLCGHATLATAHVLWEERRVPEDTRITFESRSGPLYSAKEKGWILLDFPADPVSPVQAPPGIDSALGAEPKGSHRSGRLGMLLVEYDTEEEVRSLKPDFAKLRAGGFGALSATATSDSAEFDFVSRFFAPELGIDEDPVTGAAHTLLGPFWSSRLGRNELVGHQISSRGGVVRVRVKGDRVDLLGKAITVLSGDLAV
jgi:predicted PhzF superfamily epimerase YddE/YHI9